MKYLISTLGCKVNQVETQAMEAMLIADGHSRAEAGETADAIIVNTCAVTAESGRKSRQLVRRLGEENPGAVIGICGCYSQIEPELSESLHAKVVFGSGNRIGFVKAVEKAVETGETVIEIDKPFERKQYEELPAGAVSGRTRAMLKIQDGCVNFCTYCIIPYTRGRLRSLPLDSAAAETQRIADEGYRELVLTGIEVASYGVDLPGKPGLADVICRCAEKAGDMRLRLGSLEPTVITEDFCRKLSETGKLCRHFHLSLQSGCDQTLKAMNRKYDTEFFFRRTELLRQYFPGCGLTCDLITGFPGETEEDFSSTLNFIRKCAFSDMHIFPYSRRPGTPADKMPDQCTHAVKARRAAEAQKVCEEMHHEYLQNSVGKILPVLFETEEDGACVGHSDTYVLVSVPGMSLRGQIHDVRITGLNNDKLLGEIIQEAGHVRESI
ncbi:MAG: tRNA (N(6)-L-threonylcarbamoyladenosine(37)-C(2))-methylthiotransferase MtaB [Eubacteriales bacterium]|nr:tRNA (N(6)-L-threonylcarbamoyladenosine(37)-C(2))-methylthiotransferase MtaB [Eubacteriales bacterium]